MVRSASSRVSNHEATGEAIMVQTKTARKDPAPLTILKRSELRSALANQRGRRHVAAGPAQANPQVLRGEVAELERRLTGVAAIERAARAVNRRSHIQIAIGEFDGEVVRHLVGDAACAAQAKLFVEAPLAKYEAPVTTAWVAGGMPTVVKSAPESWKPVV